MSFPWLAARWRALFGKSTVKRARPPARQALAFEAIEPRLMMSANTFPITIEVPGAVANRGVYAGVFGQFVGTADSGTGPSVYLTSQAGGTATTTTLSTTTTTSVGPVNGNPIAVESVAGFPPSGNLLITSGALVVNVSYSGINQATNSFTGTVFQPNSPGIAQGATVSLPNILGSTIPVASTANFATSGSLMLESPPGAATPRNVVVYYTGVTATSFTGVTGIPEDVSLASGGTVVQMAEPGTGVNMTYVTPPYGQNLPLINVFPADDGPYPTTNELVSATLNLPDPTTNGILSGVIVISVGSAIAIPVTGSVAAPVVGTPTPGTNPQDVFGVFEWGLTSGSLDFDVSEVDQVGFPFRVTSTGASPPPPADPNLGVGMLQDRDTLFDGFATFINGQASASNAGVFLQGAPDNANAPFPTGTRITAPQDIIGTLAGDPPVGLGATPTGPTGSYTSVTAYYAITATSAAGESMASNILTGVTGAANNQLQITWQPYAYATGYNVYWSPNSDLSGAQLIATLSGGQTTSYTDTSPASHTGNPATPPANNHGYDPLNSYFDQAVQDFFDYYRAGGTQFVLDDQATLTKWTGYTADVNVNGTVYTMLQLTGGAGQWGSQFSGQTLNVYQPLFSSNTSDAAPPPAPAWLTAQYDAWESPSSMIFGADGVFGGVTDAGTWASATTLPVGNAKDVYNNIVSAFNRGLTPRKDGTNWVNVLPPNYWASSPLLVSAVAQSQTGGTLSPGQYRYLITALDINQATPSGSTETTPSNIITVSVAAGQNQVELNWNAINMPGGPTGAMTAGSFNVYRSQLVDGAWTTPALLNSTPLTNGPTTPLTSFTDNGYTASSTSPPFTYYADGSTSNFYSAYFSQLDVSINGLGYGFPFADKNGQSTNVQIPMPGPTGVNISLNPWSAEATPEVTVEQSSSLVPLRGSLVIHGTGFNAIASKNTVKFSSGAGRVTSVNPQGTQLTVTFTQTPKVGPLKAVVTNTVTGDRNDKAVKVASIVAAPLALVVNAPPVFNVREDLPGNLVWSRGTDPFVSSSAKKLTVTLWVADGAISAASGDGVTVGGTSTARTFRGTAEQLNTYFQTAGKITYTAAGNNHVGRELTTIVSLGKQHASASSTIRIAAVNDGPTVTALPGTFKTNEDVPVTLKFLGQPFADIDSPLTTVFTVRTKIAAGTIQATSGAGVDVRGTGKNREFVGTLADLNAYFTSGRVTYVPAQDAHGTLPLTISITERIGGKAFTGSTTASIVIKAVNDAPRISAPESFAVGPGGFAVLAWPRAVAPFADPDSPALTITLRVTTGSILASSGQGVKVGGTATARTFQGSVADLNAYFQTPGRITYFPTLGGWSNTLGITASDGRKQATATSSLTFANPWLSLIAALRGP